MLTRLRIKRDFRSIARYLSDKPSDIDGKVPGKAAAQDESAEKKKPVDANKEKIQELLKSMMVAKPVISDAEYEEKFTVVKERRKKRSGDEIERKSEQIEEKLTKAAGEVASAIGGDVKQTEAELLSNILGKVNQTSTSLSDLLIGMKVDRTKETDEHKPIVTRGQQVKRFVSHASAETSTTRYTQRKSQPRPKGEYVERRPIRQPTQAMSVDIFSSEPLGIFKKQEPNYGTKLDVWNHLKERELHLATAQPPANYFQKMITWTEQGKVWQFPINNEQGFEEEQNVHFSEHIFLDAHLEDWCPKKGPIRHFMELVCTGLSKNAFYTVKEKKDHIMWYKEYFESKKGLLTEVGAWDTMPKSSSETSSTST